MNFIIFREDSKNLHQLVKMTITKMIIQPCSLWKMPQLTLTKIFTQQNIQMLPPLVILPTSRQCTLKRLLAPENQKPHQQGQDHLQGDLQNQMESRLLLATRVKMMQFRVLSNLKKRNARKRKIALNNQMMPPDPPS